MSLTEKKSTNLTYLDQPVPLPEGFTTRPATMEDVEEIVDLYNVVSRKIVGYDDFTVQELTTDLTSENFNIAKDTCLVLNPAGKIIAYQDVFATNPVPVHPIVWGRILPEYMGLGISTHLLRWGIQRAHHVLDKVPPETRVAARAFCTSDWTPSVELLESHHFKPTRHFFEMRINMESPPPTPVWPEGITLTTCQFPEGIEAFYRADDEAFKDHFGYIEQPFEQAFEQWKHRRLRDEGLDPSLWFQAMDGDQIAGFCLGRKFGWESKQYGHINLLGVLRPWRKRGLGLALLYHAFQVYWERGQRTVSLGVDAESITGAVRLYEKAGMHVHRQSTNFELELRPGVELAKISAEE